MSFQQKTCVYLRTYELAALYLTLAMYNFREEGQPMSTTRRMTLRLEEYLLRRYFDETARDLRTGVIEEDFEFLSAMILSPAEYEKKHGRL